MADIYEIRVKGHLDHNAWSAWFEGLTLTCHEDGTMSLTGPLADQAALHSQLARIRNLALPLLSVNRIAPSDH